MDLRNVVGKMILGLMLRSEIGVMRGREGLKMYREVGQYFRFVGSCEDLPDYIKEHHIANDSYWTHGFVPLPLSLLSALDLGPTLPFFRLFTETPQAF
jgi:hypothetical protein